MRIEEAAFAWLLALPEADDRDLGALREWLAENPAHALALARFIELDSWIGATDPAFLRTERVFLAVVAELIQIHGSGRDDD